MEEKNRGQFFSLERQMSDWEMIIIKKRDQPTLNDIRADREGGRINGDI